MAQDWKSAYAAMHHAGEAAFPPAALHYILAVVRKPPRTQTPAPATTQTLTPEEIITTFRDSVRADFGPLTREVLEDWRLRTPEDLGKAVLLLGRYRCLTLETSDTMEAFSTGAPENTLLFEEGTET